MRAALGFAILTVFQLALALGAPLGHAAYGGKSTYLNAGLRASSAVAVVFWALAALVILRRAGFRVPLVSERFARGGTWFLIVLLVLGLIMNLASSSGWERFGWAPFGLILVVLCLVVARGGSKEPGSDR
jgi:putative copper export protein